MQGLFNACACCCLVFCTIQRQIDDYIQVSSLSLSKLIMLVAWHFFWIKVYHKFHVINCVIVVLSCTVLWNVKNDWKLHINLHPTKRGSCDPRRVLNTHKSKKNCSIKLLFREFVRNFVRNAMVKVSFWLV